MFLSRKFPIASGADTRIPGFNGAGMFLSRKWTVCCAGLCCGGCFNGAGMFLSRKYARLALYWDLASVLQWGRDVSIPEICQVGVVLGFGQRASMGPGCFYPGNMPGWRCTGIWPACFNGAGMFL